MCLIVNRFRHWQLKPKIAKKDIPCYKIVEINQTIEDSKTTITTPCQNCFIDNFDRGLIPDYFQKEVSKNEITKSNIINHGIHSYKNITIARNNLLIFTKYHFSNSIYTIVKCYIPKGSKYWIGYGGEYCSETLKFL